MHRLDRCRPPIRYAEFTREAAKLWYEIVEIRKVIVEIQADRVRAIHSEFGDPAKLKVN
jgi:hypothetical protein